MFTDEDEVEIECEIYIEDYKEKDDKCIIDISNKSLNEIIDNLNSDILTYDTIRREKFFYGSY